MRIGIRMFGASPSVRSTSTRGIKFCCEALLVVRLSRAAFPEVRRDRPCADPVVPGRCGHAVTRGAAPCGRYGTPVGASTADYSRAAGEKGSGGVVVTRTAPSSAAATPNGAAPRAAEDKASKPRRAPHQATPLPDSVSIDDVIESYREGGRPRFHKLRESYAREHGNIVEQYFARRTASGALLIEERRRWSLRRSYRIDMAYQSNAADPALDELIRDIRVEERESAIVLRGHPQRLVAQSAYALVVFLLNVLDAVEGKAASADRLDGVRRSARREIQRLDMMTRKAARRGALLHYLTGFPIGAGTGAALIWITSRSVTIDRITDNSLLAVCLASGAIGAVISVMARINNSSRLFVDYEQGKTIAVLAGSFRPVVGAVFGGALYVLVVGGLLPLETPDSVPAPTEASGQPAALFFAGLAFIAGFSERWAQDTIVSSAPKFFSQGDRKNAGPVGSGPEGARW
jgi:hypothetical protein